MPGWITGYLFIHRPKGILGASKFWPLRMKSRYMSRPCAALCVDMFSAPLSKRREGDAGSGGESGFGFVPSRRAVRPRAAAPTSPGSADRARVPGLLTGVMRGSLSF